MNLDEALFETFVRPTIKLAKPKPKRKQRKSVVGMTPELRKWLEENAKT